MTKVLVSIDDGLLARIDKAAGELGLSRSAYLSRIAAGELEASHGPGHDPSVHRALARLQELGRKYGTRGDSTEFIRRMRDER